VSGTLRVLPLGGVGEIGKNMTVVEYDGKIVVVDCGLRFPTAEMMGIDLVLPDFTYLREHVEDIEAIVITTRTTSARCRGCCGTWGRRRSP
jgi:ribonuclease J